MMKKRYKVDACYITAYLERSGRYDGYEVNSLDITLGPKCSIDIVKFGFYPKNDGYGFPQNFWPQTSTTLGQLGDEMAFIMADPSVDFGTSGGDPEIYWIYSSSHANGHLALMATGLKAEVSDTWEQTMEKAEGKEWMSEDKYNCDTAKYRDIALKSAENVKIIKIEIGYGIEERKKKFC